MRKIRQIADDAFVYVVGLVSPPFPLSAHCMDVNGYNKSLRILHIKADLQRNDRQSLFAFFRMMKA